MGRSGSQGWAQSRPRVDRYENRSRVRLLHLGLVKVVLLSREKRFSNMLALVPEGELPRSRLVGPKLSYMDERIAAIDLVISKLVRCPSLSSVQSAHWCYLRKGNSRRWLLSLTVWKPFSPMRTRQKDGSGSARSQCGLVGPWKSLVRSLHRRRPCSFNTSFASHLSI